MRYLLTILMLCGVAYGQYAPTGTKTQFKAGVALGSKDTSTFGSADSLVVTIDRSGQMWYRSPLAWRKVTHSSGSDFVPYTGAVANVTIGNYRVSARTLQADSIMARGSGGVGLFSNSGTQVAMYGAGGGSEWLNMGFAGYNANRAASYTARSFTDKNYVDSVAALGSTAYIRNQFASAQTGNAWISRQFRADSTSIFGELQSNLVLTNVGGTITKSNNSASGAARRIVVENGSGSNTDYQLNGYEFWTSNNSTLMPTVFFGTTNTARNDVNISNTVADMIAFRSGSLLNGTGTVTRLTEISAGNYFPYTFTGNVTNYNGIRVTSPTNGATQVVNSYGVAIEDRTASTLAIGVDSRISSGTGKWNFRSTGTAPNAFAGTTYFGTTSDNGSGSIAQFNGSLTPTTDISRSLGTASFRWSDLRSHLATISSAAVSTSSTTGALIVTGGAGVGGALYTGLNLNVAGTGGNNNLNLTWDANGGNIQTYASRSLNLNPLGNAVLVGTTTNNGSGSLLQLNSNFTPTTDNTRSLGTAAFRWSDVRSVLGTFSGTTNSTASNNGTVVITGGLGVGQNTFIEGSINSGSNATSGNINANGPTTGTGAGSAISALNGGTQVIRIGNRSAVAGGAYSNIPTMGYASIMSFWDLTAGVNRGGFTSTGDWSVNATTASTSTTTGAINTPGGVGIGGALNVGGTIAGVGEIQAISDEKTANYTLTASDYTVIFNTSAASRTAFLPAGVQGRIYIIKRKNGTDSNTVTITPNGTDTIDGDTSWVLARCAYESVTLQFRGGTWYVLSSHYAPCL